MRPPGAILAPGESIIATGNNQYVITLYVPFVKQKIVIDASYLTNLYFVL